MIKKIYVCLIISFILPFSCFAHGAEIHDKYFQKIIFGDNIQLSMKEQEKIKLLNYSTRIAIDQYNSSYESELNYLKSKNIKTITSIKEIDFTSNSHHQRYTHRGWNFSYVTTTGNWDLRKQLMLDTTKELISFPSKDIHDAFTALMYYVHILGDHEGDKISNTMHRIALGGRNDKIDILDELSNIYIPILFKNQNTEIICNKLQVINRKCAILLRRTEKGYEDRNKKRDVIELTEEEYKQYQKYAKDTLKILSEEIPILLKNEKWFTKVFPSAK